MQSGNKEPQHPFKLTPKISRVAYRKLKTLPKPSADPIGIYERPSSDHPNTTRMQSQLQDIGGSHMSEVSDGAHIRGKEDALSPAVPGQPHLGYRGESLFQKCVREVCWPRLLLQGNMKP